MASRALAESPGGGGASRLAWWLSPLGESEEVTEATDDEVEVAVEVTEGRMSAAIEKRLEAKGSFGTVVFSGSESASMSGLLSSSTLLPSGMSLVRPRVGESPSPPFETICATVLAAVAAFWNFLRCQTNWQRNELSEFFPHLFLF